MAVRSGSAPRTEEYTMRVIPRRIVPALVAGLLATLALDAAADPPPTSWSYPFLPHVPALAIQPMPPDDQHPVFVTLSAVYASPECWALADARVLDAGHVALTLTACTSAPESASSWVTSLPLGMQPAGIQSLTVTATLEGGGSG